MSRVHTHYDNLKVARTAPPEVIRAAYRTLSKKYHPDHNPGNKEAIRIIQLINAAYEVLSDPAKREEHDRWIARMEQEQSGGWHFPRPQEARSGAMRTSRPATRRRAYRGSGSSQRLFQKLQSIFGQFTRLLSKRA